MEQLSKSNELKLSLKLSAGATELTSENSIISGCWEHRNQLVIFPLCQIVYLVFFNIHNLPNRPTTASLN